MLRFTRGQRGQGATAVEDRPRPLRGIRFDLAEQGGRLPQLAPLVRKAVPSWRGSSEPAALWLRRA